MTKEGKSPRKNNFTENGTEISINYSNRLTTEIMSINMDDSKHFKFDGSKVNALNEKKKFIQ